MHKKLIEVVRCTEKPVSSKVALMKQIDTAMEPMLRTLCRHGFLLSDIPGNMNSFIVREIERNWTDTISHKDLDADLTRVLWRDVRAVHFLTDCKKACNEDQDDGGLQGIATLFNDRANKVCLQYRSHSLTYSLTDQLPQDRALTSDLS